MTEIREPGFSLDLPGEWERVEGVEPGSILFEESTGDGVITVMLLAVRPVYALADSKRLLGDYLKHRSTYEQSQMPTFEQSEPSSWEDGDRVEGAWTAHDAAQGIRTRHRVMLAHSILADFCFEAREPDGSAFDERAHALLGSAAIVAE